MPKNKKKLNDEFFAAVVEGMSPGIEKVFREFLYEIFENLNQKPIHLKFTKSINRKNERLCAYYDNGSKSINIFVVNYLFANKIKMKADLLHEVGHFLTFNELGKYASKFPDEVSIHEYAAQRMAIDIAGRMKKYSIRSKLKEQIGLSWNNEKKYKEYKTAAKWAIQDGMISK